MKTLGKTTMITIIGSLVLVIILVLSSIWTSRVANKDTQKAVSTVSRLFMDELA